jgi:hypothetical protein
MTDRVQHVRIDRLVLRGVDMDLHDAASLPAWVAAELERGNSIEGADAAVAANTHDIALSVAQRIATEMHSRGREQL